MSWQVLFYKEDDAEPAKNFLVEELTNAERSRFITRVKYVQQKGLGILAERSDILESVKNEKNLFSLRLPRSQNNPRFLLCARAGKTLVVLHGFKEKSASDYDKAIRIAKRRRDNLESE